MKRFTAVLAVIVLTVCMLASCAKTEVDDVKYVQDKKELVVGITDFAPMDYEENGEWVGFDADMAREFAKSLGVDVNFKVIVWDNKIMEINDKGIDCVWNGMTLSDEVIAAMGTSKAYCKNAQVVVVKKEIADNYQTVDSIKELKFVAEAGSAGKTQLDNLGIECIEAESQADALLEVSAGTSEACVIDLLMAGAMIGEGTDYANLDYTVSLNSEEYGVGFRKGSSLVEKFNEFLKTSYDNGTTMELAKKYGIDKNVIAQ